MQRKDELFLSALCRALKKAGEVQPAILFGHVGVARSGCHLFTNPLKSSQKLQLSVLSIHIATASQFSLRCSRIPFRTNTISAPAYEIPFQ